MLPIDYLCLRTSTRLKKLEDWLQMAIHIIIINFVMAGDKSNKLPWAIYYCSGESENK